MVQAPSDVATVICRNNYILDQKEFPSPLSLSTSTHTCTWQQVEGDRDFEISALTLNPNVSRASFIKSCVIGRACARKEPTLLFASNLAVGVN